MDNRELIERLRRDLSMSLYANHADLWREVEHQRRHAADALERAEAELAKRDRMLAEVVAQLKATQLELAKYRSAEVVGFMFQHEETGNVFMVDAQQVEWGYERLNPRHQKIAPLIIRPESA